MAAATVYTENYSTFNLRWHPLEIVKIIYEPVRATPAQN